MSYQNPTPDEIHRALKTVGTYRVGACLLAAGEGPPDGIAGWHLLVTGLREAWLANINGDERKSTGEFRAHGTFQINEDFHGPWLASEPGCPIRIVNGKQVGSWHAVEGHTADEEGYAPRFTPAMNYALRILKGHKALAERMGVPKKDSLQVAFNGYNRGIYGAIGQYNRAIDSGDRKLIDAGTTGHDYGTWCVKVARQVKAWLAEHPNWTP